MIYVSYDPFFWLYMASVSIEGVEWHCFLCFMWEYEMDGIIVTYLCWKYFYTFGDLSRYWQLVGKLNYLISTRLDISYVVIVVSQFLEAPRFPHWDVTHIIH